MNLLNQSKTVKCPPRKLTMIYRSVKYCVCSWHH